MFVAKLWCGITLPLLLAPALRADGNCQRQLNALTDQPVAFTLIRYEADDAKSFVSGTTRLSMNNRFPQYFSDRSHRFPVEDDHLVSILIEPNRSSLQLGENNSRETIDLVCEEGTNLLRGKGESSELFLLLNPTEPAGPAISVDSAVEDRLAAPPGAAIAPQLTFAEAGEILKTLTACKPKFLADNRQKLASLPNRITQIKFILANEDWCKGR